MTATTNSTKFYAVREAVDIYADITRNWSQQLDGTSYAFPEGFTNEQSDEVFDAIAEGVDPSEIEDGVIAEAVRTVMHDFSVTREDIQARRTVAIRQNYLGEWVNVHHFGLSCHELYEDTFDTDAEALAYVLEHGYHKDFLTGYVLRGEIEVVAELSTGEYLIKGNSIRAAN